MRNCKIFSMLEVVDRVYQKFLHIIYIYIKDMRKNCGVVNKSIKKSFAMKLIQMQ